MPLCRFTGPAEVGSALTRREFFLTSLSSVTFLVYGGGRVGYGRRRESAVSRYPIDHMHRLKVILEQYGSELGGNNASNAWTR